MGATNKIAANPTHIEINRPISCLDSKIIFAFLFTHLCDRTTFIFFSVSSWASQNEENDSSENIDFLEYFT